VYVEVPYYNEGDTKRWKEGFWRDRMDSVVDCVGGVGFYYPKRVKVGPEERLLGGDVEVKDVIHPLEPWEHRVRGKK